MPITIVGAAMVWSSLVGMIGRAHGEELDHMRAPAVAFLLDLGADDALRLPPVRLGLHPLHGKLARVVEGLREVHHLDVLADRLEHAAQALMGHVVHAVAHHHGDGTVARTQQRPEILAGEVDW